MAIHTPKRRKSPRPAAVLFDLDGTLIDSITLILGSMRHAFAKCDRVIPSNDEWLTGVGIPLRTMFQRYAAEDAEVDRLIAAYREDQLANHDNLVRCYDDVPETLAALERAGHPLAVVTSKGDMLARRGLELVGIARHFETIVSCDSCTRHKPHPEPVLTALERLGYEPDEALFVGDSVHDIEAGNAAGVESVAALWGPFTREQLAGARPDRFIDRIGDLLQVVAGR
ncbi:MAG TPA: HAD-IA family hydrolase [Gemmatimonadaceae bacterium]|nr:HAD-IA family hydrolase [Gemmatimonadaceae bacterium]